MRRSRPGGSVRGFLAGKGGGEHAWRSLARARRAATCRRGTLGMRVRGVFGAEGHAEVGNYSSRDYEAGHETAVSRRRWLLE